MDPWWWFPAGWIDHQLYWRRRTGRWLTKHPPLPATFRYLRGMDAPEPEPVAPQWGLLTPDEVEAVEERVSMLVADGVPEAGAVVNALWLVLVARGLVTLEQVESTAEAPTT